jgi:hypothetical protein
VPDEDLVFNRDAFTNEGAARYFTVASDPRALLNLDERADAGVVADLTTIQVDEVVDGDIAPRFNVRRD